VGTSGGSGPHCRSTARRRRRDGGIPVSPPLFPLLGVVLPRTDAGQFVINLKSPTGSRIEVTAADVTVWKRW
jgi:hypothetical protein